MGKYETKFLAGLARKDQAKYRRLIKARKAYLEREGDESELLIIPDPDRDEEEMFARLPGASEATCIGKRTREFEAGGKSEGLPVIIAALLGKTDQTSAA